MPLTIKWNKRAINELIKAIEYIKRDSPQNAEKLKEELLTAIDKLAVHPELYFPDKYKLNNDSSFRAFELHRYRVSYRLIEHEIRIIRIRHTKRSPKNY